MRVIGFSEKWTKLQNDEFTTFRFERRDRDWQIGEEVQVVFRPRRKGGGEKLGTAIIVYKELRDITGWQPLITLPTLNPPVSLDEVQADGFPTVLEMYRWLYGAHRDRTSNQISKLTLKWLKKEVPKSTNENSRFSNH